MMIPAMVLRAINGFHNRYCPRAYGEDADVVVRGWQACYRMGKRGVATTVCHLMQPSIASDKNLIRFGTSIGSDKPRCEDGLDAPVGAPVDRAVQGSRARLAFGY